MILSPFSVVLLFQVKFVPVCAKRRDKFDVARTLAFGTNVVFAAKHDKEWKITDSQKTPALAGRTVTFNTYWTAWAPLNCCLAFGIGIDMTKESQIDSWYTVQPSPVAALKIRFKKLICGQFQGLFAVLAVFATQIPQVKRPAYQSFCTCE